NVNAPRGRHKVAMQTGHDDLKTFEPHADINDERQHPNQPDVVADTPRPQTLRKSDVAENQQPPSNGVRAGDTVPIHETFVLVAAVPGKESFHRVAISHNQASTEHE